MASTSDTSGMYDPAVERLTSLLSTVGDADFERFEPPADLWGRISASITSTRTPGMVVEYWIDADDVVFATGEGWVEFARDNDAPELVDLAPDRTLWSHFDTDEARSSHGFAASRPRRRCRSGATPPTCGDGSR